MNFRENQEISKSRNKQIMNFREQLLNDEWTSLKIEESSTSSNSYQTTPIVSFKRTYSIVEWSSEDSNKGTSCEEEVYSSGIFERRKIGETSTSGIN